MAQRGFSLADVGFGEALVRVGAHLDGAVAAHRSGDPSGALLHANRSLELMPAISAELWRDPRVAAALNQAAAGVASTIRARKPATETTSARDSFDAFSAEAVGLVVGPGAVAPAFRGSVVVAVLATAVAAHEAGRMEDAAALAGRARALAATLWGGAVSPEEIERGFERLDRALKAGDPLRKEVAAIAEALAARAGAVVDLEPTARDHIERASDLLSQGGEAAAAGDAFRADKLVGRAYVEAYAPVRGSLAAWEDEAELNELIGTRLRRALAAGEPIAGPLARARELLGAAPL